MWTTCEQVDKGQTLNLSFISKPAIEPSKASSIKIVPRETLHMKQIEKQGKNNKIGGLGERVAVSFLLKRGHTILTTNYLKKWGEIDVVSRETTQDGQIIHFVEVKTVSYETRQYLERAVSYGTWQPEENVHYKKIQRMSRTIQSWLQENNYHGTWQVDVLAVRMVPREKFATVKYLPNVVIG